MHFANQIWFNTIWKKENEINLIRQKFFIDYIFADNGANEISDQIDSI